ISAVLAFSPDLVDPSDQHRRSAAERAQAMDLPSAEQEVWRYSRIGELQLDRFHPAAPTTTVQVANGYVADRHDVDTAVVHDVFDELSRAFSSETILSIPRGTHVADPIMVTHTVHGNDEATFPRLVIDAGENSEVTIVERFVSDGAGAALVVPRLFVRAQQAARVTYVAINELSTSVWQLGHQQATGDRDSTTLLATVALGGGYARVRTDVKVVGQGASTRQVALYYADETQMHDFRTLQDHVAPRTTSDLLFKGAVQDTARSVYTGLIRIGHEAKGSVAYQTNRNLTLSAGAWAESVPNLEIETNDVKCSHASTIGPIDEDQRFYLESRGIPPETAERLVVLGFFDEVLDQLPVGPLAGELRAQVAAKLDRRTR
ncbi:MAG TPA: Fe-S cluster assembly protein SufD, partial [Ilumatobacteraceae bacterium]|nr:Fe-S cluster assembly protein SufD [Ilumatobacteraceae bacterium]